LKLKDTQFAAVKLPKCLEGPHNIYDRSTSSRMKHRRRRNSRDGHSHTNKKWLVQYDALEFILGWSWNFDF